MTRCRYWKLTIDEVEKLTYDTNKVLLWEIKCTREPEEDAIFIGVFLYRNGTPFDYTPMKKCINRDFRKSLYHFVHYCLYMFIDI